MFKSVAGIFFGSILLLLGNMFAWSLHYFDAGARSTQILVTIVVILLWLTMAFSYLSTLISQRPIVRDDAILDADRRPEPKKNIINHIIAVGLILLDFLFVVLFASGIFAGK